MDYSNLKLVFRSLLARKGRSILTILGIIIGVAGVIIIIALGAGAKSLILGQITKLGSDLISVQPGKSNEKGPPAQVFGIVITTLIKEDAEALRSEVVHAKAVSAVATGSVSVTWGNRTIDTNLISTDSAYPNVISFDMESGQFFGTQQDNVVVLGSSVADLLFLGSDPLGKVIKVKSASQKEAGGVPLRIIGVVAERGASFFQDQDDQIFVPLAIGQQQILGIHYLNSINIKVDASENISRTVEDVERVLMQRHRIQNKVDADFTVRNIADAIDILSVITDALRLFLTSMAGIALIVGGIGILNIMMATVAERTREIGLRKAVGAKKSNILSQFLVEAGVLTLLGGIIGIIFGIIISFLITLLMRYLGYDWAFVVSLSSIALAIVVSILTGVIFGLYPALKASRLNPIDALRYE
ncbi:ABC transporter permease [Patescibacteria group bacterium]|nr:ABC transporter permease [Patescibacteria group bacterium]